MKKLYIIFFIPIITFFYFACDGIDTVPADEDELIPWTKMSGKLAYVRNNAEDKDFLFIINSDLQKIEVGASSKEYHFFGISFKHDGSTITFEHFNMENNKWGLYNLDLTSKEITPYYNGSSHTRHASWSLDGKLSYWYNGGLEYPDDIFIDGSTFLSIRNYNSKFSRSAWSPDSTKLIVPVWTSQSQGELYEFDTNDTSSAIPLVTTSKEFNSEIFQEPAYSSDGSKITYSRAIPSQSNQSIWIANNDGTDKIQLTPGPYDCSPTWSPDGKYIAFQRSIKADGAYIFLIEIATGDITQITKNHGKYPIWINP